MAIMLYVALKKSNPDRLHKSGQTTSAVFVKLEKKKLTRFTGKLQAGCPKRDTGSAVLCNHRDKMACICTMHQRNICMISNHATIHSWITIARTDDPSVVRCMICAEKCLLSINTYLVGFFNKAQYKYRQTLNYFILTEYSYRVHLNYKCWQT